MRYSGEKLTRIYDRTSGKCHLCERKLAWKNYGIFGTRGAWEVDHSVARANGGTEHGNNLFAACISCNRGKQRRSTRSVRRTNGVTRSPMSAVERARRRQESIEGGALAGLGIGALFGPAGLIIGPIAGALIGSIEEE